MPSLKSVLFFLTTLTLGIVFFLIISGRVEWRDVGSALSMIRPWQFVLLFLCTLIIEGFAALAWQDTLSQMGCHLPWRRLWRILVVGFTVSFLTPVAFIGGEALTLYLLKKEKDVSWNKGIHSLIALKLADFIVHASFIFLGLLLFMFATGFASIELISFFTLIPIGLSIALVYFFVRVSRGKSVINPVLRLFGLSKAAYNNKFFDLEEEENKITSFFNLKNSKARRLLGITLIKYLISCAQAFLLVFFLTGHASVLSALSVHAFAGLSIMFLLPATLGSLELLQVVAFSGLGLGQGAAVGFSLIWRGMRLLMCALGVGYFFLFTGQIIKGKIKELLKKIGKYSFRN